MAKEFIDGPFGGGGDDGEPSNHPQQRFYNLFEPAMEQLRIPVSPTIWQQHCALLEAHLAYLSKPGAPPINPSYLAKVTKAMQPNDAARYETSLLEAATAMHTIEKPEAQNPAQRVRSHWQDSAHFSGDYLLLNDLALMLADDVWWKHDTAPTLQLLQNALYSKDNPYSIATGPASAKLIAHEIQTIAQQTRASVLGPEHGRSH